MQVSRKCLLSLRLCNKLKTRYNKKCWLMLAKRKMKNTRYFPGGSKTGIGKSVSVCRIRACYQSSGTIRKAAELCVKGLLVWKWNLWVVFQTARPTGESQMSSCSISKIVLWVVGSCKWVTAVQNYSHSLLRAGELWRWEFSCIISSHPSYTCCDFSFVGPKSDDWHWTH